MPSTSPFQTSVAPTVRTFLKDKGFLHNEDAHKEAVAYMRGRKDGTLRSIHTPWHRFNEATLDGLDWGTFLTIAGRPASGKTLVSSLISRRSFDLNPDQDLAVLDIQWEMHAKSIALREISADMKASIRYLSNAERGNKLRDDDLDAAMDYCKKHGHKDIFFFETALNVSGLEAKIIEFLNTVNKPTIITIDHSLLTERDKDEKSMQETLGNLAKMLARLRKHPKYKVIIILLSQLNRDIESTERLQNGTIGNYVKDSDLFGADAVFQSSDIVVSIHRPGKYGLTRFGVENYMVDPTILIVQFLKVRSGAPEMQFYKADFANSNIIDIGPPPCEVKNTGGKFRSAAV